MKRGDRLREAAGALSGPPGKSWRASAVHHGARILLLLAFAIGVYLLFPVAPTQDFPALEKGMVAEQDIIAQVGFPILKSDAELQHEREEAAASVAPVFQYDAGALDSMLLRVRTFITLVDSTVAPGGTELAVRNRLRDLLFSYSLPVDDNVLNLVRSPANRQVLAASLQRAINSELPVGIASSVDMDGTRAQQIRVVRDGREQIVDRDSVPSQQRLYSFAARHLPWDAPTGLVDVQRLVLVRFFEPSLRLERQATELARDRAREAVPIVKGEVLPGERVIAAHTQIRDPELERLRSYQAYLQRLGEIEPGTASWPHVAGALLLNLLLLSIFAFHLYFFRPEIYSNFRHVLLLAVLMFAVTAGASVIGEHNSPVELVPIAFPALVVAALWDGRLALNLVLVLVLLISAQTPFLGLTPRILMIVGGGAAALSVRVMRRRAEGLILGAIIGAAYAVASIALGLLRSREMDEIVMSALWGSVNGVASALIAMGFLPLFESWTKITTDQTLLELADLNRPLLKRLSLEASGSYAHSINVANLAEAATRGIDGNTLLARVGSYYHDVGKMATPQYFVENQARGRNPHDHLDPAMSAAIVRAHVVEGMRMAEQAKLPDSVKQFIPEHHGTQPIGFFYEQAQKQNPDAEVDVAEYSYAGPKPQSKETAIVMVADSVESATKALQEPTRERIAELVDRIVDSKIRQGQFDEAPLTLAEITIIKQQFVSVLSGMYHHRLDYPAAAISRGRVTPPGAPEQPTGAAQGGG